MQYDAIIVGGGIAGLTAAAYISRAGRSVLLCEKEAKCGGLVNNFERDGFIYDGGIRALENSGVLFPMLRQLGLELDFVPNRISVGIEDQVIRVESDESVDLYGSLLKSFYPHNAGEIDRIISQVRTMMKYMEVQYGIENPMFLDPKKDRDYFIKEIFPWMFKYLVTAPRIARLNTPVEDFLRQFTSNQSLIDIIAQHFFRETPAYFALSYLKLYLDYHYPLGGTGKFVEKLLELITTQGGEIRTGCQVAALDVSQRWVRDANGAQYNYKRLIWAADLHTLYRLVVPGAQPEGASGQAIAARKAEIADKTGNDSVHTIFLGVNLDSSYFSQRCTEHFFYTPDRTGQSAAGPLPRGKGREEIQKWLEAFLSLTTYEISIPVLRDSTMAPAGKTGLIISFLSDYQLTKQIEEQGWYEEFKTACEMRVLQVLGESVFPGIGQSISHIFSSSPLTLAKLTGNHEGAITGWAFTNRPVPAESRIPKILNAIKTPIPAVYQAGQWTYSPAGLPVSLLTGKIAADQVVKDLKKEG